MRSGTYKRSPEHRWRQREASLNKLAPLAQRLMDSCEPEPMSGCWIWMGRRRTSGYGGFGRKTKNAHRVSFEAFRGPIRDGLYVLHKCDVRPCINPDHLFLGTISDNSKDAFLKARKLNPVMPGSNNPNAKLNDEKAREIRRRAAAGEPPRDLAAFYGVSRAVISTVIRGIAWRHIAIESHTTDREEGASA